MLYLETLGQYFLTCWRRRGRVQTVRVGGGGLAAQLAVVAGRGREAGGRHLECTVTTVHTSSLALSYWSVL